MYAIFVDYCLPNGYDKKRPTDELNVDEIATLVGLCRTWHKKGASNRWRTKPTPRLTCHMDTVANTNGIDKVCISTNGYRLGKQVQDWLEAGLSQITSIDSFDPDVFAQITGQYFAQTAWRYRRRIGGRASSGKINAILKAQHANASSAKLLTMSVIVP